MVLGVAAPSLRATPVRRASANELATLDAMARLAAASGAAVHVVQARAPGVVEYARAAARAAGVEVSIDLMPYSIRVRLAGVSSRRGRDAPCAA
jgi:dihydroorotase-like cyclic amidohydrolase